jgi:hypothetical protein
MSLDKQTIAQLKELGAEIAPEYLTAWLHTKFLHEQFMIEQHKKTELWKFMSTETRAVVFRLNELLSGFNWWAKLMTGQRK